MSQHLHPHVFGDGKTIVDPRRIINYARRMVLPCGLTMAGDDEWDPTQVLQGVSPDFWLRADQGVYTGGSRDFEATSSAQATRASFAAVNLSTTDFSIVASINRESTGNQVIAAKYQDADNYWRFEITAGHKLHFIAVVATVTLIEVTGATSVSTTGQWYTAAVTVDRDAAGTTEVYLNGVNDTSGTPTVSATSIDNTGAFFLGESGAGSLYFDGLMASVGVFKADLLTQSEVTWLDNSTDARVYGELGVAGTDGAALAPSWWANCNDPTTAGNVIDQASTNDLTTAVGLPAAAGPGSSTGVVDGDPVTKWTSLEGNAYDFLQAIASQRPYWTASIIGSKPALKFDGLDDILRCATAFLTSTTGTFIAIFRHTAVPNAYQDVFASSDEAGTANYLLLAARGDTANPHINYIQNNGGSADVLDGSTTINVDTDYAIIVQSDGTTITAKVLGVAQTLAVDGGANNGDWWGDTTGRDNVTIGALKRTTESGFFAGYIAEIYCHPLKLNDASLATFAAYILSRYGLVL